MWQRGGGRGDSKGLSLLMVRHVTTFRTRSVLEIGMKSFLGTCLSS